MNYSDSFTYSSFLDWISRFCMWNSRDNRIRCQLSLIFKSHHFPSPWSRPTLFFISSISQIQNGNERFLPAKFMICMVGGKWMISVRRGANQRFDCYAHRVEMGDLWAMKDFLHPFMLYASRRLNRFDIRLIIGR